MARPRRSTLALLLGAAAVLASTLSSGLHAFLGAARPRNRGAIVQRRAAMPDNMDLKELEGMMKDPKKVEEMQKAMDDIMKDPAKKKMFDDYQTQMQSAVQKLKDDPEMKDFFEDVEKNGMEAIAKWQKDERILRKFSQATGGVPGMGMPGMGGMGAPPAAAAPAFKPGDEVIIQGLSKAPELNGKKAMVVPPTSEERKTLEGTDRLIVRLMGDSGDQFAVRPANLKTLAQEVDEALGQNLEDVSVYNPALQTEAAKLRDSGKLEDLQNDPELKPIFEDIRKNGMGALEKYWNDEKLMAKISKAMQG
uniref:STI1/HOP DP domain-containing protein n=1 Tax=Alexandrium monilatum TaxID=311494 RepID=A0A7S4RCB1_9DINO